jgi:hypothetical protein
MPTAVIVDAVRTPLGRRNGKLKDVHPVEMAAHTLKALVERNDLDPALVEDVIMGCVMQVGDQGLNIARNAALAAGFPESTVGTTIDRQCGSSQQAAHFAAQGVIAGAYDVVIAAGVESMSRVPMGTSAGIGGTPFGPTMIERYRKENLYGAGGLVQQGISAEIIAEKWHLSREALDERDQGLGREIHGVDRVEGSGLLAAPQRGADGFDDDGFTHGAVPYCPPRALASPAILTGHRTRASPSGICSASSSRSSPRSPARALRSPRTRRARRFLRRRRPPRTG